MSSVSIFLVVSEPKYVKLKKRHPDCVIKNSNQRVELQTIIDFKYILAKKNEK